MTGATIFYEYFYRKGQQWFLEINISISHKIPGNYWMWTLNTLSSLDLNFENTNWFSICYILFRTKPFFGHGTFEKDFGFWIHFSFGVTPLLAIFMSHGLHSINLQCKLVEDFCAI